LKNVGDLGSQVPENPIRLHEYQVPPDLRLPNAQQGEPCRWGAAARQVRRGEGGGGRSDRDPGLGGSLRQES
jgi:hypothetical protein